VQIKRTIGKTETKETKHENRIKERMKTLYSATVQAEFTEVE